MIFLTFGNIANFSKKINVRQDVTQRKDEIIALLSENEVLSAAELSAELTVSVQTVRTGLRDLD